MAFFLDRSTAVRLLFPSVLDPCFHGFPDRPGLVGPPSPGWPEQGDGQSRREQRLVMVASWAKPQKQLYLNITCVTEGAEQ